MTEEEYIAHYGVKGMKWYQSIFGDKRKTSSKKANIEETPEQRRERVLKSTNAKELYANRHLLTTAEINERISRINTEKQLAALSALEKTAAQQRIDKITKVGKTINDLYTAYNKPMVQQTIAKLSGKSTDVNYEELLKNVNKLSNPQLLGLGKRIEAEEKLAKYVQKLKESTGNLEQSDTNSDYLAHFGVLGMKWGKRKKQVAIQGTRPTRKTDKDVVKYINSKYAKERQKGLTTLNIRELMMYRDFLLPQEIDEKLKTITLDKKIKALKNTGNLEKLSTALFDKKNNRSFAQKVDDSLVGTGLEKSFEKINKVLDTKLKPYSSQLEGDDDTYEKKIQRYQLDAEKKISDAITALDDNVIKYLDF